jgi:predicted RNA binding protein YcfA (HicA-like mRNA interferase family)
MGTIQNISLEDLKSFLKANGLKQIRTKGGHLVWSRSDLRRPVIIQSHISPVPEFIVRNILRTIGSDRKSLESFISGKRGK